MKKILYLILLLLPGCNQFEKDIDLINSNFSDELSFEEYRKKLEEYTNLNKYPNLNEQDH